jgi:hypothetical protein
MLLSNELSLLFLPCAEKLASKVIISIIKASGLNMQLSTLVHLFRCRVLLTPKSQQR